MGRGVRRLTVAVGAMVLTAAVAVGVVGAQAGGDRRGFGRHGFGGRALAQLDLTAEQREQVRVVRERHEAELKEAGQRLRTAHQAHRSAVEKLPVDEGLIRSTSQTLADAQADMGVLRARVHSEIWTMLTPDQQKKAQELKAQREARMKERQERRQQRREGRRQG
jgi:protein CpxP